MLGAWERHRTEEKKRVFERILEIFVLRKSYARDVCVCGKVGVVLTGKGY